MVRLILLLSAFLAASGAAADAPMTEFMLKNYPPTALKNGEEGKVGFSVNVGSKGEIEQCQVTSSSGYPTLDRETCDFIVQFLKFAPMRDAKGDAYASTKAGAISWKLPPGTSRAAAPTTTATLPPPVICKKGGQITGSMVKRITQCMTEAEWRQHEKIVREEIERVQGRLVCSDHGCT